MRRTSLAAILVAAVTGAATYALHGDVKPGPAALVGVPAVFGVVLGAALQQHIPVDKLRAAAIVGFASIAGVQLGVLLAESLPESTLRRFFGVLLLITAVHVVWRTRLRS